MLILQSLSYWSQSLIVLWNKKLMLRILLPSMFLLMNQLGSCKDTSAPASFLVVTLVPHKLRKMGVKDA